MSADNEVTAAKAAGISPMALIWPALILAFSLSLFGVWLNDLAFSWGQAGMQRVILHSVEEIAYGMLRKQRSFANARFSIIVKEVDGRELIRPIMTFQPADEVPAFTLSAVKAELKIELGPRHAEPHPHRLRDRHGRRSAERAARQDRAGNSAPLRLDPRD